MQAANIYGGFLSRRLSDVAGDALKALTPVRSIRRLQLGGATQGGEGVRGVTCQHTIMLYILYPGALSQELRSRVFFFIFS